MKTISMRAFWRDFMICGLSLLAVMVSGCQPLPAPTARLTATVNVARIPTPTESAVPLKPNDLATGARWLGRAESPVQTPKAAATSPVEPVLPQALLDGYRAPENCFVEDLAPDHTWILLHCEDYWVENLWDGRRFQLTSDKDFPDPPRGAWSPDGAWLALNARTQTWLFHSGDWQNHRVLYGETYMSPAAPDWLPDSQSLAVDGRIPGERLARLGIDGSVKPLLYDQDIRPVPKLFEYCYPEWSPDSKSFVYLVLPEELVGKLPEYFELWIMDIASGAKRKLIERVINPLVWSPDGTKIALYTKKGAKDSAVLGILDPLTATVTPIPNLPKTRWAAPKWAPDSQRLALSTEDGVFITTLEGVITPVASQAAVVLGWTSDNQYLIIGTSETISSGFQEMIKAISIE